jgi:hypothetical protein
MDISISITPCQEELHQEAPASQGTCPGSLLGVHLNSLFFFFFSPGTANVVDITTPTRSSAEGLARLFPPPRLPPSVLAPGRMPGVGPDATFALLKNLKDNHERSHIFFNHFLFHKYVCLQAIHSPTDVLTFVCSHAAHHLIALYALGADAPLLDAAYEGTHLDHMRDAFVAPEGVTITEENFTDYIGDDQYVSVHLVDRSNIETLHLGTTTPF